MGYWEAERVVLNALAADAAVQFDFCTRSQRVIGDCAFGDYFLASPRHGDQCSDDERKTVFQAWQERVRVDLFLWHRIQKISASTSSGLTRRNSATSGGSAFSQHGECSHESKASHRTGKRVGWSEWSGGMPDPQANNAESSLTRAHLWTPLVGTLSSTTSPSCKPK